MNCLLSKLLHLPQAQTGFARVNKLNTFYSQSKHTRQTFPKLGDSLKILFEDRHGEDLRKWWARTLWRGVPAQAKLQRPLEVLDTREIQCVRKLWNNGNDRRFDKNDNAVRMDGVCIRYASICDELPSVCRTWFWMNSKAVLLMTIRVYRNKLCFIILLNHF